MAKVIYLFSKNRVLGSNDAGHLSKICRALEPDNVSKPIKNKIYVNHKVAFGVLNYQPTTLVQKDNSLLLGILYDRYINWDLPLSDFPDGSYTIFRDSDNYLEIISDPAASKTIWYYHGENFFIASTSQRAIIMYLGSFEFDKRVIPWMFSTGTLGPEFSWDKRLNKIGPDSSVILDKSSWTLSCKNIPIVFHEVDRTDTEHEKLLTEAISDTIESLKYLDIERWVLPLSGGYDSRALLCFLVNKLNNAKKLRTVTWGLEGSTRDDENDAKIAKDIAMQIGVAHDYYHTDVSSEPIEKIFDRFMFCGEGRIDNISGYMDGFRIWKELFENGVLGIIRGEEAFGFQSINCKFRVLEEVGCQLCSQFKNLCDVVKKYELPNQELPDALDRQEGETLEKWRDRLAHINYFPIEAASLADLKLPYVEVINPLLSRRVLNKVREMPDHLRTKKLLFKRIVNKISPDVGYATKGALASLKDIFSRGDVNQLMIEKTQSPTALLIFDKSFTDHILKGLLSNNELINLGIHSGLANEAPLDAVKIILRRIIPKQLLNIIKGIIIKLSNNWAEVEENKPFSIDHNVLAFRVYIIIRMYEILNKDSSLIDEYNNCLYEKQM